ncbi:AraC family transcriptional regulator [Cohnella panacarvi]|uniref:AraC family transcriptional regulator n=1 Tax=Cohnella panacarvi TaxID=400776 RepID=UPI00047BCE1B|nr:AraC family transcriptional regulator [Cohnella panacarvi]
MNKSLLKEERKHGTPVYPVSLYEITCSPDHPLLYLHWHDELEFLLVTEGRAAFRVDASDYELNAGEAIFVNSGLLHSGSVLGEEPCSFVAVVFHPSLFGNGSIDYLFDQYIVPVIQETLRLPVHLQRRTGPAIELLDMLHRIAKANRDMRLASEMEIKGLLFICLSRMLALSEPTAGPRREQDDYRIDRLKAVIEHIEQHYAETITLRQLAGIACMSESYFCRFFKKITTKSPVEYMNGYRVQQAAARLRETDDKMMEIALDVGFNSLSYFNVVFRGRYGCTPSDYRKKLIRVGS